MELSNETENENLRLSSRGQYNIIELRKPKYEIKKIIFLTDCCDNSGVVSPGRLVFVCLNK